MQLGHGSDNDFAGHPFLRVHSFETGYCLFNNKYLEPNNHGDPSRKNQRKMPGNPTHPKADHIKPPPSIPLASARLSSFSVATFTWSPRPSLRFFSMTTKVITRMSVSRVQDGWMRRHVLNWPVNTPLATCEGLCSYMALTLPVRT